MKTKIEVYYRTHPSLSLANCENDILEFVKKRLSYFLNDYELFFFEYVGETNPSDLGTYYAWDNLP